MVGHIEEISVLRNYQGKGLGKIVIGALDSVAKNLGCAKTMLDCSAEKKAFYAKCGYHAEDSVHMSRKMGLTAEDGQKKG